MDNCLETNRLLMVRVELVYGAGRTSPFPGLVSLSTSSRISLVDSTKVNGATKLDGPMACRVNPLDPKTHRIESSRNPRAALPLWDAEFRPILPPPCEQSRHATITRLKSPKSPQRTWQIKLVPCAVRVNSWKVVCISNGRAACLH